jgi:multisubunit Na+/H+ antiporter MnhB subunit
VYAGLPPAGALGVGGASALSLKGLARPGSGFQALATVVAATTLVMAGASLCKLLPPRRRVVQSLTAVQPHRWDFRAEQLRQRDAAWVAVS